MNRQAIVIGAGLAGCEAAYQLAERGIAVTLYEMKPQRMSPAHHMPCFAELVCSNSLRGAALTNAVGLLKEEMRRLGSLVMQAADMTQIPAGGALAVDRAAFSKAITDRIRAHPLISVIEQEITAIPNDEHLIIATGPLTAEALSQSIRRYFGKEYLSFFDAAAPIVTFESIDKNKAFFASRYNKGTPDYINCPMTQEQYHAFYEALIHAECAQLHDFDHQVFEGCMPIEEMARRGKDTMRFGPLKPVGLVDDRTGARSYGVVHRNTYLNAPALLNRDYSVRGKNTFYFAGQITGVEGYVESAASGLVAGLSLAAKLLDQAPLLFPDQTAIGALGQYISAGNPASFQPMNINFGIIAPLDVRIRSKAERYLAVSNRSLALLDKIIGESNLFKGENQ